MATSGVSRVRRGRHQAIRDFRPETVESLQKAFGLAWAEVCKTHSYSDHEDSDARDDLAKRIVELAHLGERDAEKLRQYGIDIFTR